MIDLNELPLCLSEVEEARRLLNVINQAVEHDARQGTSSDVTRLIIVGLPKSGQECDEQPYVSCGGTVDTGQGNLQQVIDAVEQAIQTGLEWGTADPASGIPDLSREFRELAEEVGSFAGNTLREYALAFLRPYCGMVFLNNRPCEGHEETAGVLECIKRELERSLTG